jgi:O-antigen/teichoic acid export membrane protein
MSKQLTQSLSFQASIYALGKIGSFVISFFIPVLLVRIFTKMEYGTYAQFMLIYLFLVHILRFGFETSLFYHIPRYPNIRAFLVSNIYILYTILGVLCFFVLYFFRENIAGLLNSPILIELIPYCGFFIFFSLISFAFESLLIIQKHAKLAALLSFSSEVLRGLLIITFALIYRTIEGVALSLVIFSFIRFTAFTVYVQFQWGFSFKRSNWNYFKSQLKYSYPLGLSSLLSNISNRVDKFAISSFFTPEMYAIYSAGNFKVPFISQIFVSIGEVVLPRAVMYIKQNNIPELVNLWNRYVTRLSFISIGVFFLIQVLGTDLITLIYTENYINSVPIFKIITAIILFRMLGFGTLLKAKGQTKDIFSANTITFILSLPTVYFLVKYFGTYGAASSVVIMYGLNAITQLYLSIKCFNLKLTRDYPIFIQMKLVLIGILLSILILKTQDYIPFKIVRMTISSIVYSISYLYLAKLFKIFDISQEGMVKHLVHKFISPIKAKIKRLINI